MQAIKKLPSSLFNFFNTNILVNSLRQSSSSQPSEYITTNLANGVGRYVCQLQRITFKFCKESPNSHGLRSHILCSDLFRLKVLN